MLTLLCLAGLAGTAEAQAAGVYVALGDSYTSAPLVPNQYGEPIDCGRSDHNYPSLVAQAFAVDTFVDVSCGSAQTKHMTEAQTELPLGGTNPPQFNALRGDATLVTVGIGGNDAGLVGVAEKCAELGATNPTGTACRDHWAPGGNDRVAARIEATKPKIAAVLQGIHQRAPNARVAIVGYPDVLPKNGGSCWPMVPLSPDDIRYIDELIVRINAMIEGRAAANDAEFVDTYADSGGHDVCKLPPERWFEGLVPTEPAYPLHPNGKGEASMARSAIALLSRPRERPAGDGPGAGAGRCLARRSPVGASNVGRIRLGLTRARLLARVRVRPARRTARAFVYCASGGGRVAAVFAGRARRARAVLVISTARGHGNRRVRPGSRRIAIRRAYPRSARVAAGVFRVAPRSRMVVGAANGRVSFVGVATRRLLSNRARLAQRVRLGFSVSDNP